MNKLAVPKIVKRHRVWIVPLEVKGLGDNTVHHYRFRWDNVPDQHLSAVKSLASIVLNHSRVRFQAFHACVRRIYKFSLEMNINHAFFHFTESEWGAFSEWLTHQTGQKTGKPLQLSTQRGYIESVRLALELASETNLCGVSIVEAEAIYNGTRHRFRDLNFLAAQRAARRAWTEDELDSLLSILREEWHEWQSWCEQGFPKSPQTVFPDLPTVVAAYLCFQETVRPEEINVMTVDDIYFENESRIFLHAPNKSEGWISIDRTSEKLLKALIDWGKDARLELGTRRLFVEPLPKPTFVGTRSLNLRMRALLDKYRDKFFIDRPDVIFADGRKTLGSLLAAVSTDREIVRITMRHKKKDTMMTYYVRQGKVQLSKNIEKSLGSYATRLAMAYERPVIDPKLELSPDKIDIFNRNPDNFSPYGACLEDVVVMGNCRKGIHCGDCKKLVPMVSKLENFEVERDFSLNEAREALDDRTRENHLAHAAMLQGHILNIKRRMNEEGKH